MFREAGLTIEQTWGDFEGGSRRKRRAAPDRAREEALLSGTIPFERYPGLPPLFLDFLRGLPDFYPDPPSVEAAAARARELLGQRPRLPAEAFRSRVPQARAMAEELAAGRAVAVLAGHQVGLFTGPLFTVTKAFDAIRIARDLTRRGVPAVPVFWALTDDHDLDEIARTARPGKSEARVHHAGGRGSLQPPAGRRAPAAGEGHGGPRRVPRRHQGPRRRGDPRSVRQPLPPRSIPTARRSSRRCSTSSRTSRS